MERTELYRWAAIAAYSTAALLVLGAIGLLVDGQFAVPSFAVAHLLLSIVIVAIYAAQTRQSGLLGLVGFVLMLLGNMLFFADQVGGAQRIGPLPSSTLLTLGVLLFAIANTRAAVLPSYAAWLMFLGLFLNVLGGQLHWPELVNSVVAPVLNGLGIGWFGVGLRSHAAPPAQAEVH